MSDRIYREKLSDEWKHPLRTYCVACGHKWTAAYLPMNLNKMAQIAESLRCPSCAASSHDIRIKTSEKELTST